MADSTHLQPVDVAKRLDVSTNTIRRWANEFGLHLSPEASPAPGRARSFSPRDLYVLGQVHQLSQQGLTLAQIDVTLQSLELPDVVAPLTAEEEASAPVELPEGLQLLQSMVGALDNLTDQSDRLTRLESHQDDVSALRDEVVRLRGELHETRRNRLAWPAVLLLVFVSAAVVATAFALVTVLSS